jgi:hypothetical protein
MTPEAINALVNMGSAGAVIAVVIIFLKSIEKRDTQWRDFFTALNSASKEDICELAETMSKMVKALTEHDVQAKAIKEVVTRIEDKLPGGGPGSGRRSSDYDDRRGL